MKKIIKKVELENLITITIATFLENVEKFGYKGSVDNIQYFKSIADWYLNLEPEKQYKISSSLLDIFDDEINNFNKSGNQPLSSSDEIFPKK